MNFDFRLMSTSHFIKNHPLLEEDLKHKIKYLNALQYFTSKYSSTNEFATQSLQNYKEAFLKEDISQYSYNEKLTLKQITKGAKIFMYRYYFMCDCLFINSMLDENKASDILDEIKSIYFKIFHKKLDIIFETLYGSRESSQGVKQIKYQVAKWNENKKYLKQKTKTILTTATMSAGKSTLINSLIGKKVNKTMNDACTSKLHYITDKAFEDEFNYKLDNTLSLNASQKDLLNDNSNNSEDKIFISTYFRLLPEKQNKLCIIDTPGVNSSFNEEHKNITEKAVLEGKYDNILYVVNAENFESNDDLKYMQFICENVNQSKLIFILNKLDRFREPEDSIEECISHLRDDLLKLGIENPIICPVSSYAGNLAKKKMFNIKLSEDEEYDYLFMQSKFKQSEYDLSKYYDKKIINRIKEKYCENDKQSFNLLIKCGLLCLEEIITEGGI